ncbi:hypothetical protein H6P81_005188 [Aristolochia fimbriata]|uniref:SBP-type domain-containing protein n=1 Tax=Aristolochia fimbriata TaxID=158543 RepID=A0AAV7EUT6_ARIFI|nr:hypothetical protein H6P81_005188 [Aristolochia fimbriata]
MANGVLGSGPCSELPPCINGSRKCCCSESELVNIYTSVTGSEGATAPRREREREMLEYEWGNPATMLFSGEESHPVSDQTRQVLVLENYHGQNATPGGLLPPLTTPFSSQNHRAHDTNHNNSHSFLEQQQAQQESQVVHSFSTLYGLPFQIPAPPDRFPFGLAGPKAEDFDCAGGGGSEHGFRVPAARIGLDLGGRTYFASSEDDFVSRLYRRSRGAESAAAANAPRCQAEGCAADLGQAKHYHRRHKVCEFHSKAATVAVAGLTQRFCQQCSRFHLLLEFDHGKRSCRRRLADHNRRRRKSQPQQPPHSENPVTSRAPPVDSTSKSSSESGGTARSSSVTVAISPPRISLDRFGPRHEYSASSSSPNSRFSRHFDTRLWD